MNRTEIRDPKRIEFYFNKCYLYVRPLGPNKTFFRYFLNADPSMDFIPPYLMNLIQSTATSVFLGYVASLPETMSEVYAERLVKNSAFYDRLLTHKFYGTETEDVLLGAGKDNKVQGHDNSDL